MNVLVFGATGMVGRGVLLECLDAADVEHVTALGRAAVGLQHPKLRDVVRPDLLRLADDETVLAPFDACFFCLGVSSVGMDEARYTTLTHDLTMAIAEPLARLNPQMTFVYVSGASTDSSERGKSMWARVKGRTENALQRLPFKAVYLFRPGVIQPVRGVTSKVAAFRVLHVVLGPLLDLIRAVRPDSIITTQGIGLAMLEVARHGAPRAILESDDLKAIVAATRG